jgi:hypothetical protein
MEHIGVSHCMQAVMASFPAWKGHSITATSKPFSQGHFHYYFYG